MPADETEWQRLHFWARKIALPSGLAGAAAPLAGAGVEGGEQDHRDEHRHRKADRLPHGFSFESSSFVTAMI